MLRVSQAPVLLQVPHMVRTTALQGWNMNNDPDFTDEEPRSKQLAQGHTADPLQSLSPCSLPLGCSASKNLPHRLSNPVGKLSGKVKRIFHHLPPVTAQRGPHEDHLGWGRGEGGSRERKVRLLSATVTHQEW